MTASLYHCIFHSGILPALGHDRVATETEILGALSLSPSRSLHITHLFNVCSFHHRYSCFAGQTSITSYVTYRSECMAVSSLGCDMIPYRTVVCINGCIHPPHQVSRSGQLWPRGAVSTATAVRRAPPTNRGAGGRLGTCVSHSQFFYWTDPCSVAITAVFLQASTPALVAWGTVILVVLKTIKMCL